MPHRSALIISVFFSVAPLAGCLFTDPLAGDATAADSVTGRPPADSSDAAALISSQNSSSDTSSAFAADLIAAYPDCGEPTDVESLKIRVLELVNSERAAIGLNQLTWNVTLEEQATSYACEMIHYDFFDHVNPVTKSTLGLRADEFNYDFQVIGENLAAGQRTPEKAMQDWMNSPGHRQNILDPRFVEIGIGVRVGGDYGMYWVQEFGLPAK